MNSKQDYGRRKFLKNLSLISTAGMGMTIPTTLLIDRLHIQDKELKFESHPVLTNIQPDQVEVIVAPSVLSTGWIEYGKSENLGRKVTSNNFGRLSFSDRVLRFKITDLEPGSKYFYRVHLQKVEFHTNWSMERTNEIKSDTFYFTTLDSEKETATFACWNDTHENDETIKQLTSLLENQKPDFLIWNGDITNDIFDEDQIVGQFLNPGEQAFATTVPMMLSRGNHDVRGKDSQFLEDYLTGPDGLYHYGFRQGPLASIVLDSGEDKPDDNEEYGGLANFSAYRSMQAEWLESVIEESWFKTAPFKVVFVHIPMVWNGESRYRIWDGECMGWICEDSFNKWHNLFEKGRVQLVISGHTHRHRFIPPDDQRSYGQLIGGGPEPERATFITGKADKESMVIEMTDLQGTVIEKLHYSAS